MVGVNEKIKTKTGKNRKLKENAQLYLIMAPVLIQILIFSYIPLYGIIIAFQNYLPGKPFLSINGGTEWVGLKHFINFIQSPMFGRVVGNTIWLSFLNLIFGFFCPIIFALLLNEIKDGFYKKFVQTTSYMPYFISSVVVAGMVLSFVGVDGIINQFLGIFGVPPKAYNVDPSAFAPMYTITNIWKTFGWGSILYLSTITAIDPGIYESACIDGANRWERIVYITLPCMKSIIIIQLIFAIGNLLNANTEMILLMYNQATYRTADVIGTYVYRDGLLGGRFSYGTAVNTFVAAINFILLIIANKVSTKVADFGLW
ncbi:MAG: ABC transporter permease subunit [Oscillospiraceae bacterium]